MFFPRGFYLAVASTPRFSCDTVTKNTRMLGGSMLHEGDSGALQGVVTEFAISLFFIIITFKSVKHSFKLDRTENTEFCVILVPEGLEHGPAGGAFG